MSLSSPGPPFRSSAARRGSAPGHQIQPTVGYDSQSASPNAVVLYRYAIPTKEVILAGLTFPVLYRKILPFC